MDDVTLEDLLNDPHALTKVQIRARRERALAIGALLGRFARAIKRRSVRLLAPRASAGQRAAHCG